MLSLGVRRAASVVTEIIATLPEHESLLFADDVLAAWRSVRREDPQVYLILRAKTRERSGRAVVELLDSTIGPPLPATPRDLGTWPQPLDLEALAEREPQSPPHIIPDWLPAGEVTLLGGHGGAGKSRVALDTAVAIAVGGMWYGLAAAPRRVLYVSAEDSADVMHWRLARVCRHLGISIVELAGRLDIVDASRLDAELIVETRDGPVTTPMYDALAERMRPGAVLVLDGASDLYGASEIIRRHVRYAIRALRRLVPPDGAALLVAHVDKATARSAETSEGYSGSTAWHNSVRARWYLRPDSEAADRLILTLAKANHARAGAEIKLRWNAEAHVLVAEASPADGGVVAGIRDRIERESILAALRASQASGVVVPAAMTGPRTAFHALSHRPELAESLRSGRPAARRFWSHIEALRQMRSIAETEYRRSNRHIIVQLVAVDIGSAPNALNAES